MDTNSLKRKLQLLEEEQQNSKKKLQQKYEKINNDKLLFNKSLDNIYLSTMSLIENKENFNFLKFQKELSIIKQNGLTYCQKQERNLENKLYETNLNFKKEKFKLEQQIKEDKNNG